MYPQRLPIVNSDDGTWGNILRKYLEKEHYNNPGDVDDADNGGHKNVTIRAGTAGAGGAPLKFTTGTLLTTPEAGAMEFAGDNLYLTQTSGTTRKKVALYDDSAGATGDIYYRNNSGYFTRLGIGTSNQVLTASGSPLVPTWQTPTSGIGGSTGSTDNAVLRADGTGGATTQGSVVTIADTTGNMAGVGTINSLTLPSSNFVGLTDTQTLTNKRVTPRVVTVTQSATPAINTDNGDVFIITGLAQNITSMTTNLTGTPTNGQRIRISVTGTAARTIAWGTSFEASTKPLPTTTVSTNRLDIEFIWNTTTSKWRVADEIPANVLTSSSAVTVAQGGTGRTTSTTAYGIIAAGTSATNAHQTISPGTSGQFLKSAGANALGAFANITASDISGAISGMLLPVQGHTRGEETYTIASGSVTQISGTTLQGVWSPSVGDRILIHTAPASSGAGMQYIVTSNPANGIYVVTSNTTNLSLSRATDMSGSINPAGLSTYSETPNLPWLNQSIFTVVTPSSAAAFTYGSGSIAWATTGGQNLLPNSVYIGSAGGIGIWNNTPGITTDLIVNSSATGVSGTQTITLPATPSDTLIARTSTDTLTNKRVTPRIGSTTSNATPTVDTDSYDQYNITALAAAITSWTISGTPTDGQKLMIRIKDNGTARALAWPSSFRVIGVTLPTTTVASKTHYVGTIYNSADAKWDVLAVGTET